MIIAKEVQYPVAACDRKPKARRKARAVRGVIIISDLQISVDPEIVVATT
jgi:hypothetical protein